MVKDSMGTMGILALVGLTGGGVAAYLLMNQQEPLHGTLGSPLTCWDGSTIYQTIYDRNQHAWLPYQTAADCPTEPVDGSPDPSSAVTCDNNGDGILDKAGPNNEAVVYTRVWDALNNRYVNDPTALCTYISGTLSNPVLCADGNSYSLQEYDRVTGWYQFMQCPTTPPAVCTPNAVRNQLTDCWNGVPYGGEICAADGMSWVANNTTCPVCGCVTGEYNGATLCTDGVTYAGGSICQNCGWVANPVTVCPGPITYNYKVVGSTVQDAAGATAYTGASFTAALQWAIENHPSTVTYVPAGTYTMAAETYPASGTTLIGDGPDATILNFTAPVRYNASIWIGDVDNVTLRGFRLTGNGAVFFRNTTGTHGGHLVEDVIAYQTGNIHLGSFATYVSLGATLDGLTFNRVQAISPNTTGFAFQGEAYSSPLTIDIRSTAGWVRNVSFTDCVASGCGIAARYVDETHGFELNNGVNMDNVHFLRCSSEGNWVTGYSISDWCSITNCTFDSCDASHNGVIGNTWYGSASGWTWLARAPYLNFATLTNCTGFGNFAGDVVTMNDTGTAYVLLQDLPPTG